MRLSRLIPTLLALLGVVGLSGSMLPQTSVPQTLSSSYPTVTWSISNSNWHFTPQVIMSSTTTLDSTIPKLDSYGPQQLQLSTRQDFEGILYEDYRSRRSRVVICIEIAKRLAVEPLTLTNIALLTRVNFSQARICLEQMMLAGLVQGCPPWGRKEYALTRKGMLFLESGEQTLKLLQPEVRRAGQ